MALTNIKIEPRREIIEQAMGLLVVATFVGVCCGVTAWTGGLGPHEPGVLAYCFNVVTTGILLFSGLAVAFMVLMALGFLMHGIGEGVCGFMANRGWDPRPATRYARHGNGIVTYEER